MEGEITTPAALPRRARGYQPQPSAQFLLHFFAMRRLLSHACRTTFWLILWAAFTPHLGAQDKAPRPDKPKDLYGKTLEAAQQALEHFGEYDNSEELRRVTDIGYRLAQETRFDRYPFSFHLIDMPEPNAFALPGGQIFITRGMLDLGLSDEMLAGLLGHEIGHVVQQHGMRIKRRATLLNILSQALVVGVIISAENDRDPNTPYPSYDPNRPSRSGSGTRGDLIQGTYAAGVIVSELLLRSYSREFEDEADEEGQRWAAGAGFSPTGTQKLMDLMRVRLPQSSEYGYWQTHPFFSDRVRSAGARQVLLKVQPAAAADAFRRQTQQQLLEYATDDRRSPETVAFLKASALAAWPVGQQADELRLERLHKIVEIEKEKPELARDFGYLQREYDEQLDEVRELSSESVLLTTLSEELTAFKEESAAIYPKAIKVLQGGIYETEFLETFLSNYPESPEVPPVALGLGEAYSRLGRQSDAVSQFLRAWDRDPDGDAGRRARQGLQALTPVLDQLGALQQIANLSREAELSGQAQSRLTVLVGSYEDPANGSEYLDRYPSGPFAEEVLARQNTLADALYGEVVLYQSVGDHVKALERIQKILTYAPTSQAAERLRDKVVVES